MNLHLQQNNQQNYEGNDIIKFDDREFTNPNYRPEMANRRNGNHQLTRYLGVCFWYG